MGITLHCKTKAKASLKLFNHINTYLFEQEYMDLKGNPKVKEILIEAKKELKEVINKNMV